MYLNELSKKTNEFFNDQEELQPVYLTFTVSGNSPNDIKEVMDKVYIDDWIKDNRQFSCIKKQNGKYSYQIDLVLKKIE
jgi:hypothetical protein